MGEGDTSFRFEGDETTKDLVKKIMDLEAELAAKNKESKLSAMRVRELMEGEDYIQTGGMNKGQSRTRNVSRKYMSSRTQEENKAKVNEKKKLAEQYSFLMGKRGSEPQKASLPAV